jgi:hypothetical protein
MCWRDLEKILDTIAVSDSELGSHPSSCPIPVSPDHLNYDINRRIKTDIDQMRMNVSKGNSQSAIESPDSCLHSLELIEDLEDQATKQLQKSLKKAHDARSFNRREYNAFIGRMRLHIH